MSNETAFDAPPPFHPLQIQLAEADAAALLDAHPEAIGVHDHRAGPVLMLEPTSAESPKQLLEGWLNASGFGPLRATPARAHKPLRLRIHLDAVDGPIWLGLLAQCAWLRGGIIGARVGVQSTS